MGEPVQEARKHGQSRESDHRELQRPRAARDVDEQRSQMAQEQDSLPRARLALPRVTRPENKRHVGHAKPRRADQELEQDLETPRLQLQALDGGAATAEESAQRVAHTAGSATKALGPLSA